MKDFTARPSTENAGALLRSGRARDAVRLYRQAVQSNPRRADAHNNLAVALKAAGDIKEAIGSYRRAIKLDPSYLTARRNLARALRQTGDHEEAISHLAWVHQEHPDDLDTRAEIVETLTDATFSKPSPVARRVLLGFFRRRDTELQRLALPTLRLLMTNRRFKGVVDAAADAYPDQDAKTPLTSRDLADPLLIALLTWTLPPSRALEIWVAMARRRLLMAAASGGSITADQNLLWALAAQCHAGEYAAPYTRDEREAAIALAEEATADDHAKIAIAGTYLPLVQIPAARGLWDKVSGNPGADTPMRWVLERTFGHPEIERDIAAALPRLTPIEDLTSMAVRDQYEHNPYPKWLSIDREIHPQTLSERLGRRFPTFLAEGLDLAAPRILVAGCGTGRHAITTAARYKDCSVLAVDISLTSLGYAARQAQSYDQGNITFSQADILGLGQFDERFDLIECSGVLHHMADPSAGWRILRGLVKPRGLMRIGLYSATARKRWEDLRAPIPNGLNAEEVAGFLRERRGALLTRPPEGPESIVLRIADFYSLSGCRDLLFHTSERLFSIPEITNALAELDLDFLGFDGLPAETIQSFRDRFKQPDSERDLSAWDAFETENPDAFIAMYQFWCQARA
jgi:SAM-dependent methyltransferase